MRAARPEASGGECMAVVMERWNHLSKEEREPYVVAAAAMNAEKESSSDEEDTDDEELEGQTLSAGELASVEAAIVDLVSHGCLKDRFCVIRNEDKRRGAAGGG
eukprot:COSAG05_NODE_3057_length_2374_cov_1.756923_2_plen_104_part_00